MKNTLRKWAGILVLLLAGLSVRAAAPANDMFANAWLIAGPSVTTNGILGTTGNWATTETGEPNHGGNTAGMRRSVWFAWVAPTNGLTSIDTLGSAFNTVLAVYTGTAVNQLTLVAQNDDAYSGTNRSRVFFTAVKGTSYKIAVAGITGLASTGTYLLHLQMFPAVSLSTPMNESAVALGTSLYLRAEAGSPNGSVNMVEFYGNGAKFSTDYTSPYEANYSASALGTNSYYAVVTDSAGFVQTSAVVNVHVMLAGVKILSPPSGSSYFGTAPIPVWADAAVGSGSVSNVEFYANGIRFAQDATPLYSVVWTNVVPGANILVARMTSSSGLLFTSTPVTVTVIGESLVQTGAVWKYLDNGSDPGTAWVAPGFNDSGWASGPAELGYGDDENGRPEATVVSYGPDANNKYITTYFRRSFPVTQAAAYTNLVLRVLRDDGAVVYLNGVEAGRFNMPAGTINYLTTTANATDDGTVFYPTNVASAMLIEGTNVLAVEIHQTTLDSSDISFDLELVGEKDPTFNRLPLVSLSSPTNGAALVGPANVVLTAAASDADGSVTKVEFFSGTSLVGRATNQPYSITWSNVAPGTYTLKAVATDDKGATNTSSLVVLRVWAANGSQWVAFNDYVGGAATSPNATTWNGLGAAPGDGGLLEDIGSGASLPASLTITNTGAANGQVGARPATGTPAYNTFTPYVTLEENSGSGAIQVTSSAWLSHRFTGLNPHRRYSFRGTGYRGVSTYTDRWALFALVGADYFTPSHTANVLTPAQFPAALAPNQAAMNTGDNTSGDMVGWGNIAPGPDGVIEVTSTQYLGPAPGNGSPGSHAYALTAVRLEESAALPVVNLTAPTNGSVFDLGAPVILSASAGGFLPVTNVEFRADAALLGSVPAVPYTLTYSNLPFGTNHLLAVAVDSSGVRATSAVVQVTLKTPANQEPPVIVTADPPPGSTLTALTSVQVTFSEPVAGVNAADFLVNGLPASGLSGSGSSYTFTFTQPALGTVQISWLPGHGIADYDQPPKPFDATGTNSHWSYQLVDLTPPAVANLQPSPGATVRTLTRVSVLFSEPVTGVDAADLLVKGAPAQSVSGAGAGPYVFQFAQPSLGRVDLQWAAAHGIRDFATPPNAFTGSPWSYTLDPSATFADSIVISEIMYHPMSEQATEEWIELHNRASESVNLTGWRFTRGIDYTFPGLSLPGGGYLVVAASTNAFRALYPDPGLSNVLGDWAGRLANSDDTIELRTAADELVDSVHYASEGEWATRACGRPVRRVESITPYNNVARVRIFGHGCTSGDQLMISGADQPGYNGRFTVLSTNVSTTSFLIAAGGLPAASGTILCRQIVDNGASGWSWFTAADGLGSSLELVNPAMPNEHGQNWAASANPGGSPGRANSVAATNAAPFILEARHFPVVPQSSDVVTLTARVLDEQTNGVQAVTLFYRDHSTRTPSAFTPLPMLDDGAHNDGPAGDRVYGATLAAQPAGTVMEYYIEAADGDGLIRYLARARLADQQHLCPDGQRPLPG